MDPFLPIALTFGMIVAASQQAAVIEQYAARARQGQTAVAQPVWEAPPVAYVSVPPVPAPVPGWVAGATVGSQVGALVGAANPVTHCGRRACGAGLDPRPVVAGAVIGGLIGHAASQPPVVMAHAPSLAPPRHGNSAASRAFQDHWQNFMQPSVSRSADGAPTPAPGWWR